MSSKVKADISLHIKDNLESIKNPLPKLEYSLNQWILDIYMKKHISEIDLLLKRLKQELLEISPYIKDLRWHINDISEETAINANYLIFSSVIQKFHSIIILANEWQYSSIIILLRNIEEGILQCNVFSQEYFNNENENLRNWYLWKIISHSVWRELISSTINSDDTDIKGLKSYIYQMTSQFAHNWYVSVLESISPYTEDFDIDWVTPYYRTISSLKSAFRSMDNLVIALKSSYMYLLKDFSKYDEIDRILLKYNPDLWKVESMNNNIKDMFPKS